VTEAGSSSAKANPRRPLAGNTLFFPAAAVYAVFVLPASVLSMTGIASGLPGLDSPAGHAHEMLFGFALAVVAGNQLGALVGRRLAALAGGCGRCAAGRTFFGSAQATAGSPSACCCSAPRSRRTDIRPRHCTPSPWEALARSRST